MTEEIIIDGGRMAGIKTLKSKLKCLEQENKELKVKVKELNEMTGIFSARLCDKYRSTFEEIRELSNIVKEWAVFMKPIDRLEKINKIVSEVLQWV